VASVVSNGDAHSGFRDEHGIIAGTVRTHRRNNSNPTTEAGELVLAPEIAACLNPGHEAKHSYAGDGGTLNIVGVRPRRLTPRECERLQGFPDDWTLIEGASDSARYRALGNAVAVPCVEWILRRLAEVA
jgi:site-specific DNA-cytosine methylase